MISSVRVPGTSHGIHNYFERNSKNESTRSLLEDTPPLFMSQLPDSSGVHGTTLQLQREITGMLLKLKPNIQDRIFANVRLLNISLKDLSKVVTLHIRRGDKMRESRKAYLSGKQIMEFLSTHKNLKSRSDVYILSDDATAIQEVKAAAPSQYRIMSISNENQSGFNECLLPSVRDFRKGLCNCKKVSEAAKNGFMTHDARQKSYCFVNPQEQNPLKLVSVLDREVSEEDAAIEMLTDLWIASRSAIHVAVGCGSNVDKMIKLLRSDDPNNVVCLENKITCSVNEKLGTIAGLQCNAYV